MGLFVTYNPTTNAVNGRFQTQVAANSDAADDATKTALVGEQNNAINNRQQTVNAAEVTIMGDWFVWPAESDDEGNPIPRLRQMEILSPLERLKAAARLCHNFFVEEVQTVRSLIGYVPIESITEVENMEFRFHQGLNAIVEDKVGARRVNSSNDDGLVNPLTIAQKITFCNEVLKGATDITNARDLTLNYQTLKAGMIAIGLAAELPIDHPIIYVDPRNLTRVSASAAVLMSGERSRRTNDIAGTTKAQQDIIEDALELTEPPTHNHLNEGDWIDRLVLP